jgi:hypothetical protein
MKHNQNRRAIYHIILNSHNKVVEESDLKIKLYLQLVEIVKLIYLYIVYHRISRHSILSLGYTRLRINFLFLVIFVGHFLCTDKVRGKQNHIKQLKTQHNPFTLKVPNLDRKQS